MAFESALARKTGKANFSFELNTFFVKLTVSRAHLGRHVCSTVQRQRANTPVVHVVSRSGSGLQWGVYGSGADCVYSDVLWGELHSQRSGEGNDGSLGGGVVHHACRSLEGGDGGGVDYRGSGLEVWNGISETRISRRALGGSAFGDSLGQGDHSNDVGLEGALDVAELRAESSAELQPVPSNTYIDILDGLAHDLLGGVIDKDVKSAVVLEMLVDDSLAVVELHQVKGERKAFTSILLDGLFDVLSAEPG